MKLGEAIKTAVRDRDAGKAAKVADVLRFGHGYTYQDTLELFRKLTGIDARDFETLMYEADGEV